MFIVATHKVSIMQITFHHVQAVWVNNTTVELYNTKDMLHTKPFRTFDLNSWAVSVNHTIS